MPKKIQFDGVIVSGIAVSTKNAAEMSQDTAKIPQAWQNYFKECPDGMTSAYGVYFNYESDQDGEYKMLAGQENPRAQHPEKLEQVKIDKGNYLVFERDGEMPQVIHETWQEVWAYFNANNPETRAFTTDFEFYETPKTLKIYIAIK